MLLFILLKIIYLDYYNYSNITITSNAINKFKRKKSVKTAVRVGKGFTLFILNEDMDDIIKIIKSL